MILVLGRYQIEVEFDFYETIIDAISLDSLNDSVVVEKYFRFYTNSNIIARNFSLHQELIDLKRSKM
jgi:hypothetical protein